MPERTPFFQVALNLPHAGRVARRILLLMPESTDTRGAESVALSVTAAKLEVLLAPYLELEDNPPAVIASRVRTEAAALGRKLVDQIETARAGHDRLGQCVRNLFECLEMGREGAGISLRAGEDPRSFQRPR
ncbi:MAG: hypothetical protein H7343_10065 [Undibacterium sp.]|nr:hypothetical protein [Opitutaceae bacterium]